MSPGDVFRVVFPFKRCLFKPHYCMAEHEESWEPGVRQLPRASDQPPQYEADGEGVQILTVVSLHKPPGRYQARVFYTQQFEDPDGKVFGTRGLRVVTQQRFGSMTMGYAFRYEVVQPCAS